MKYNDLSPHTHTGKTTADLTIEFGAGAHAKLKHEVTVPKGTEVVKLYGGEPQWVVADLSFIQDTRSLMYSAADKYGIAVPEEAVEDIQDVEPEQLRERLSHGG